MSLFSTPFDPIRDTALVTGAGNGIGRAIAQALVGEGVRTVFADVDAERVRTAISASESHNQNTEFMEVLGDAERSMVAHPRHG